MKGNQLPSGLTQEQEKEQKLSSGMTDSINEILSSLILWSRRLTSSSAEPISSSLCQDQLMCHHHQKKVTKTKFKLIPEQSQQTMPFNFNDHSITSHPVDDQSVPLSLLSTVIRGKSMTTSNNLLEQNLIHLQEGFNRLIHLAPLYDFDDKSPGNGLRALMKLIYHFLKLWESKLLQDSPASGPQVKLMTDSLSYINAVLDIVLLIEDKRQEIGNFTDLLNLSSSLDKDINDRILSLNKRQASAFLSLGTFWLSKSMQFHNKVWTYATAWRSQPMIKSLLIISPGHVKEKFLDYSIEGNVHQLKKIWSSLDLPVARPLVSAFNTFKPNIVRYIHVPRQSNYIIKDSYTVSLDFTPRKKVESEKVSCLYLRNGSFNSSPPKDTLIIHLHGGGYVSAKPKSHELYLRKWASKLEGIPILSIDYSLSPESPFPVSLQEILDVYLFVTGMTAKTARLTEKTLSSEQGIHQEIISLIGFTPKNIVLMGDSAGSSLSISLMHIIQSFNQEITCIQSKVMNNNETLTDSFAVDLKKIPLPASLFLPYPYTNPSVMKFTPSRTLMAFDPLLSIGAMYSLSEAYHPKLEGQTMTTGRTDRKKEVSIHVTSQERNNNDNHQVHHTTTEMKKKEEKVKVTVASSTNNSKKNRLKEDAWYRKSKDHLERRLTDMEQMNLGPFFHPLKGRFDHPDFKEIPMFIQVGEFDPLLDESIFLAKKWTGKEVIIISLFQ